MNPRVSVLCSVLIGSTAIACGAARPAGPTQDGEAAALDAGQNAGGGGTSAGGGGTSAGGGGASAEGGGQDSAPPPHVLRACSTLGSTSDGGADAASALDGGIDVAPTWGNATPPAVNLDSNFNTNAGQNYGTNAFVVDPQDTATVYLGTSAQGIYKTTDCGATWVHINTGMNGSMLDQGRQWTMVIDPIDPRGVIYTNSGYGPSGVFKSTNGGVDWQQILSPTAASALIDNGFIERIAMDPTDHLHLTVTPHFSCQNGHTNCMLETTDGGATWAILDGTPPGGEGSGQMMVNRTTWFWAQGFGGLWRTSDEGATWQNVANSNGYAYDSMFQAPDGGSFYMPAAFNVIQSSDGINWSTMTNSPSSSVIAGSSTTIYSSQGGCVGAASTPYQPISAASVTNPTTWTTVPSPLTLYGGGYLQYDEDHNMLYSSSCLGGFWRASFSH